MLRLSDFRNDLVDKCDQCLVYFMAFVDCLDHLIFRNFLCSCFDHDYFLFCRCNGQCKIRYNLLCGCRVKYKLSIYQSYLCRRDRTVKWNIGNTCCQCGSEHCCQFRAAILINCHNEIFQCYIISVILREQRTHRTVNNTVCQDRIL